MMRPINHLRILILFLICKNLHAQNSIDLHFLKHLSNENKKIEHLYYLQTCNLPADSFHFLMAKYAIQYGRDSDFQTNYEKSKVLFLNDSLATGYTACYLLQQDHLSKCSAQFFKDIQISKTNEPLKHLQKLYSIQEQKPRTIDVSSYPNVLRSSVQIYKKAARKSASGAALMSAIVPGLGKMYIGKFRIGFNALLMNGIFAAQTYESIHHLGVKHPLSILNLILCSFFYASNIYGSYRDTQYYKTEKLQALYHEASNYYSVQYFPTLYK